MPVEKTRYPVRHRVCGGQCSFLKNFPKGALFSLVQPRARKDFTCVVHAFRPSTSQNDEDR